MLVAPAPGAALAPQQRVIVNGRLRQSVCRWCYAKIPLPEFFKAVADMGLTAIDLLPRRSGRSRAEYGLTCSMGSGAGGGIADGLNVKANHDKIVAQPRARHSARGGAQGAEPDHVLRQPPRHGRRGGGRQLRRGR